MSSIYTYCNKENGQWLTVNEKQRGDYISLSAIACLCSWCVFNIQQKRVTSGCVLDYSSPEYNSRSEWTGLEYGVGLFCNLIISLIVY